MEIEELTIVQEALSIIKPCSERETIGDAEDNCW